MNFFVAGIPDMIVIDYLPSFHVNFNSVLVSMLLDFYGVCTLLSSLSEHSMKWENNRNYVLNLVCLGP